MEWTRPVVAVLGGGQLGRMLGLAGLPLGLDFRFLDPSPDAPAAQVGALRVASLADADAAAMVAAGATVVTYEWEGVPAATARAAAVHAPVLPGPAALAAAQDRVTEKTLCTELGLPVPAFAAVDDRPGLDAALGRVGLPAVLKTRRGGYDGKGQRVLRAPGDADAAWAGLGGHSLILEELVPFDRELALVAVRGRDGAVAVYPVVETEHRDGVLRAARAPAPRLTDAVRDVATAMVNRLLEALDYRGVLAVELFDRGGELLVNELAPRVHNSGHWTIEGATTSQFENHLRGILGWPLGAVAPRGHAATLNLLGAMPDRERVLAVDGAHLHDYRKQPRPGRKVGHVTVTGDTASERDRRLDALRAVLDDAAS